MMKPRISMITLGVADLARSVALYRDGLGLPQYEFDSPGIAFFNLDGSWLSLFPRTELAADAGIDPQGSGFAGFTLAHNVHSKDEVDSVIRTMTDAGARLVKPAEEKHWGGYSGYVADPDGYLWEVAFNPFAWVGPED